jgi:hypothetical protein
VPQGVSGCACIKVCVHQIDRASDHRCACASFILGERLGIVVRLYEQQALDQQVLQIVRWRVDERGSRRLARPRAPGGGPTQTSRWLLGRLSSSCGQR